jgi:hypothetical protein
MNERGQEGQEKAQYYVINPKSITMGQLYGQVSMCSNSATTAIYLFKLWIPQWVHPEKRQHVSFECSCFKAD